MDIPTYDIYYFYQIYDVTRYHSVNIIAMSNPNILVNYTYVDKPDLQVVTSRIYYIYNTAIRYNILFPSHWQ